MLDLDEETIGPHEVQGHRVTRKSHHLSPVKGIGGNLGASDPVCILATL